MRNYTVLYEEIMALTDGPVRYEDSGYKHLKMTHKKAPRSIVPLEFEFIEQNIQRLKLLRGVEIGTAFGVSSLAAGLDFKQRVENF